jgi:hypothetical protein
MRSIYILFVVTIFPILPTIFNIKRGSGGRGEMQIIFLTGGTYQPRLQGRSKKLAEARGGLSSQLHGIITQKAVLHMVPATRTS